MGIISKVVRKVKKKLAREPTPSDPVPKGWAKKKKVEKPKAAAKPTKKDRKKKKKLGEVLTPRGKRRLPGLATGKRWLAFGLLGINLIFSQYILGTQNEGKIFTILFLANCFILADYLWKTRRPKE